MGKDKKIITRHDVAKLAGVSHMTVTRALNGHSLVTSITREKVFEACRQLNYRRNLLASSLRSMRSYGIGVIVPTFRHEFYGRLLAEIETEAKKNQYHIIASQINATTRDEPVTWEKLEFLLARKVDGFIIDADLDPEIEGRLVAERIPVVCINRASKCPFFDLVATDYAKDFQQLTQLLLSKGHQKIVFVGGVPERLESRECYSGYAETMTRNNLTPVWLDNAFSFEDGVAAAEKLVGEGMKYTAVVGITDYIAIGLISGFSRHGIRVPQDIAVSGHAGEVITQYFVPSVTTGEQPVHELAVQSVQRLISRINHPEDQKIIELRIPAVLVERDSTGITDSV